MIIAMPPFSARATMTLSAKLPPEPTVPKRPTATREHSSLVARLVAKRRLDPETGCWLWQGRRDRWGYGRITVAHRRWSVHRLAATLYFDLDPASDLHVLHRCHTPPCFRPDHLYLGTNDDNVRDRIRRRDRRACSALLGLREAQRPSAPGDASRGRDGRGRC